MKTMTFRDLFTRLTVLAGTAQAQPDLEVIVRVQNDDGETMVGGLFGIEITAGCSEIDALVLDGSVEAESRHTREEHQYGVGEAG